MDDSKHASAGPVDVEGAKKQLATFVSSCFECVPRSASLYSFPADGANDELVTKHGSIEPVMDDGNLEEYDVKRRRVPDRSHKHRRRKDASSERWVEGRDSSTSHRYSSDAPETPKVDGVGDNSRSSLTRTSSAEVFPGEDSDPANSESSRGDGFGAAVVTGVVAALVGAVLSSVASHAAKLSPGRRGTDGNDYVDDGAVFGHGDGDRMATSFEAVDGGRPAGREEAPSLTGSVVVDGDSEDSPRGFASQSRRSGQNHRLRGSARDDVWLSEAARAKGSWSPAEEGLEDQSTMHARHRPPDSQKTTEVATNHAPDSVVSTRRAPEYPPSGEPLMMTPKQKRDTGTRWRETIMHRDPGTRKVQHSADAGFLVDERVGDDGDDFFFGVSATDLKDNAASVYTRRGLQVRFSSTEWRWGRECTGTEFTYDLVVGDHGNRSVTTLRIKRSRCTKVNMNQIPRHLF